MQTQIRRSRGRLDWVGHAVESSSTLEGLGTWIWPIHQVVNLLQCPDVVERQMFASDVKSNNPTFPCI